LLSPPLSDYEKRVYYCSYDVLSQLNLGMNTFEAVLGNGRYFSPRLLVPFSTKTYGLPCLASSLVLVYEDGQEEKIESDRSWKVNTFGPIRRNNEYDGESFDARMDPPLADKWMSVDPMPRPWGQLVNQRQEPLTVTQELEPISWKSQPDGSYLVDFGQNLVGFCRLQTRSTRGNTITLGYAERLDASGNLYVENLRSAECTDTYISNGADLEQYTPQFTFHGFRYVLVSGLTQEPDSCTLKALVVHDKLRHTGTFESTDTLLNSIYSNCVWGIRGNYRSIPTDCPQRDERHGWLGDRAFSSLGETYIHDVRAFYKKWLQDIADTQDAGGAIASVAPNFWLFYPAEITWSGTFVTLLVMLYRQYGDRDIVQSMYPAAKKWLTMQLGKLENGLYRKDFYGDWCMPPETAELIHSQDPDRKTAPEVLGTCMLAMVVDSMQQLASVLGLEDESRNYQKIHSELKEVYNREVFNTDLKYYSNGTVTAQILSLAANLVPADRRSGLEQYLQTAIQNKFGSHISCGFVGIQHLYRQLAAMGRSDLAVKVITQPGYPGYEYMISQGATTVWELWNGNTADPSMNSGNHVMLIGDMISFFYENLAGIQPAEPGFLSIILKPEIHCGLTGVKATFQSPRGLISSHWTHDSGNFTWKVHIPLDTPAVVKLPSDHQYILKSGENEFQISSGTTFRNTISLSPGSWVITRLN